MSETAIVVSRDDSFVRQDRYRRYDVKIDGEIRGKLKRGESQTFSVAPGNHVVEMVIDWCGSPPLPVQVKEGESVWLRCWPALGWRILFPFGWPHRWIGLDRVENQ